MDDVEARCTRHAAWNDWFAQRRFPSADAASLVPAGTRAVVIAPHPDDEVLGAGGMLTVWAGLGRQLRIVAVSDGGASHPGSAHWTAETLGAARRAESVEGWRRLGLARNVECRLQLPDGELADHADALTDRLCQLLMPGDVVFATWRLDGHPDHEATGRAAAVACARRGCTLFEYPVWMWRWAVPGDAGVPWHRLRRLPLGTRAQAQKAHALQAHVSQLKPEAEGEEPVLPASELAHWLGPFEHVFVPEQSA